MSLWTRCKSLWNAVVHPTVTYIVYEKTDDKVPKEVWDRVEKAFVKVEEAFDEVEKAIDSLKKK